MDINKLKQQLERTQAKQREETRKAQAIAAKLANASRVLDTRRKILIGSWAMERAERIPEFKAMMLRELDRIWLARDNDRALFDLPALNEEEKAHREIAGSKAARKRVKDDADVTPSAEPSGGSEDSADAA